MKSIKRHLIVSLIGGAAILLGLASIALYGYSREFLLRKFDAALRSKALALVTLIKDEGRQVEFHFADEFMPEFERPEQPEYFQVWLASGATLERSRSLVDDDLPRQAGPVAHPAFWDLPLRSGQAGRAVGIQFHPQRDGVPAREVAKQSVGKPLMTLVVARERSALNRTLAAIRIGLAVFAAVLLTAMALLVAVVVRRGLSPLGVVAERATAIDASSLQERFPAEGMPEELRPICDRLNDLLARLEEAFQRERRISADIAHELGTPLSELRAVAEVALKWPEDSAATAAAFQNVLTIAQKMEAMVNGLLALARSEQGKLPIRSEPLMLADLVDEIWAPLGAPAQRKQIKFAMEIPRELRLQSDPALLRHILNNVLHNAVEYSPAGTAVRVQASLRQGHFDVTVENRTDNLNSEDLPRLFERFWRKDPARSNAGHGGLGLTLAHTVAAALGFSLTAEMPTPGILRLALRGPVDHQHS